jgi:hypothetical protein
MEDRLLARTKRTGSVLLSFDNDDLFGRELVHESNRLGS